MIDIGVNLTSSQFRQDRQQVIQDAWDSGVTAMVVTGTTRDHSEHAVNLARDYSGKLYATAGVHPHHASDYDDECHTWLKEFSQRPEVRAVGECGLDYNRNYSPPAAQREAFAAQLDIAIESGKPAFLHQRDAHEDFMRILHQRRGQLRNAVVHCFTGTDNELRDYLELDLYVGITGWICDERRGRHLREVVKSIPLNRIMIETDAPYLLPRDLQPKPATRRNEPRYLAHVCNTVAACLGLEPAEFAALSTRNAHEFFALDE